MATQLLIYETAVPVSNARHGTCSVEVGKGFAFTRNVNSVPLMAIEFPQASPEYPVVFAQGADQVLPAVILGARQNENLYLAGDESWRASYLPAFIRRYPFVFSPGEDGQTFTLCVDEAFPGLNREGRGQALFTAEGKPSEYVDQVLKFLQEYRLQFVRTEAFCKKLQELDLLEPMQAQFTLPSGEKISLSGFLAVDRKRLKALPADKLHELAASDELELIYLHLQSMRNFNALKDRLAPGSEAASPAAGKGDEAGKTGNADGGDDPAAQQRPPAGASSQLN
ncbi:SapC family protein [Candidatus Accumulibacter sp. ACC007]|uniref:SapC family protein n=1 Tax=Candidatus Accumulibacter sp. ACC007 TaxID=2823333 RepID=UPI0025B83040|nr:SapC family protein [Candidatus Accumulibacter sp. ACC007]